MDIFSDWSFIISGYDTHPSCAIVRIWNLTIGLKKYDKILALMNFELNQMVGLGERDQSKFLGVVVEWHMSIML